MRPQRLTAPLLLAALVAIIVIRGVMPAISKLDADFPSYFTAAKIVADRGDVARLYDIPWFQQQMRRYGVGVPEEGKFSPFPPCTALLLVPLVHASPQDALRILTGVSALALVFSAMLLAKIVSRNWVQTSVFVLLAGYAICNGLRFGQPYILVSAACVLGYFAYLNRRPVLAGVCFGLFVPFKYFPIVFLIYFALRREWRVALGGGAVILAIGLSSVAILGWQVHEVFLYSVLGDHLAGNLSMQDPFAASFQSFDSLYRRLFVFDASANSHPLLDAAAVERPALLLTKAALLTGAIVTLVKLARTQGAAARAPSMGIIGISGLLLAPATATYHLVLLWLPLALLTDYLLKRGAPLRGWVILGAYALIGFFPYRFTEPFEGRGALTVLAYPRLLLLLAMFIATLYFVWRPVEPDLARGSQ